MSIQLMGRYLIASIPANLKLTAMSLCEYSDARGMCFPSIGTLCAITGYSERKVRDDLRELEQLKLLKTQFRKNQSSIYWLNTLPQKLFPCAKQKRLKGDPNIVNPLDQELGNIEEIQGLIEEEKLSTELSTGGQILPEGGANSAGRGANFAGPGGQTLPPKQSYNLSLKNENSFEKYVADRLWNEAQINLYLTTEQRSLKDWQNWLDTKNAEIPPPISQIVTPITTEWKKSPIAEKALAESLAILKRSAALPKAHANGALKD